MKLGLPQALTLLLPTLVAGQSLPAAAGGWRYFYITATSYGTPGNGSEWNPYDGSTQEKFDAVMAQLVAWPGTSNRVVVLLPGVFWTRGTDHGSDGWRVGEGCSNIIIRGSGEAVTTLNFTNAVLDTQRVVARFGRAAGYPVYNCGLEDLTIDAGTHVGEVRGGSIVGAVLYGSGNRIRRVTVRNLRSSPNVEAFGLNCTRANPEDYDNAIEGCRVLGLVDAYASGFVLACSRSRLLNCYVDLGPAPTPVDTRWTAGISVYGSQCVVMGNTVTNVQRGIHGDSTDSAWVYANNIYTANTLAGHFGAFTSMLAVRTNTAPRWTVDNNTITAYQPSNYWLIAWAQPATRATNTHPDWVVMHNRFRGLSTNGLWHRDGSDWSYLNNQFDAEPRHVFSGRRLLLGNTNRFGGPALAPVFEVVPAHTNGGFQFAFRGDSGPSFRVEGLAGLNGGPATTLLTTNLPLLPFTWTDPASSGKATGFYRLWTAQ